MQRESFREELLFLEGKKFQVKPPNLVREFGLLIDEEVILRCRTGLKHAAVVDTSITQILLPEKHYFTSLTIRQMHSETGHNSVAYSLSTC